MRNYKFLFVVFLLLVFTSLLFGCGQNQTDETNQSNLTNNTGKSIESDGEAPVTLKFASLFGVSTELQELLKDQFPNVKFVFSEIDFGQVSLLLPANNVPDIILDTGNATVPPNLWDDIKYDLSPHIATSELDLSRFQQGLINRVTGEDGGIYSLPYSRYFASLFYNKTIFDEYNIPYPVDDMSWDEVIELASQFSKSQEEMLFRSLDIFPGYNGFIILKDQFQLNFVDPDSEQSMVTKNHTRALYEFIRRVNEIHGNKASGTSIRPDSLQTERAAMGINYSIDPILEGAANGLDIDMVTMPTLRKGDNIGAGSRIDELMITKQSENKKIAFEVISYLVSDEIQLLNTRNGYGNVIDDHDMNKQFGANIPELENKNTAAFFKLDLPVVDSMSTYEMTALFSSIPSIHATISNDKDIDTILNELDDSINKAILAEKDK